MKRLLNETQASTYLSDRGITVHPKTLERWAIEKKIRRHKIGRYVRFSQDDIDTFLKSSAETPPAELKEADIRSRGRELIRKFGAKPGDFRSRKPPK